MADAKEIVGSITKILGGLTTSVFGAMGGPAAADGANRATTTVDGIVEKYLPSEKKEDPSAKSPRASSVSPVPPTSRVQEFDQTDFKSRAAKESETRRKRLEEARAKLQAAKDEAQKPRITEIRDVSGSPVTAPLTDDARSSRSVPTRDGAVILDLGPMDQKTDATLSIEYLKTLGYTEQEIDSLLLGPTGSPGKQPAESASTFRTLEVYGQVGEQILPLDAAIEEVRGKWRARPGTVLKVAHTSAQGTGLAGAPGAWGQYFPTVSPSKYGLHKDRGGPLLGRTTRDGPRGYGGAALGSLRELEVCF